MSGLLVTTRETFSFSNLSEQINTRDYANFDTLHVLGLDGTDTFNVTAAGNGQGRDLFVDADLSSGKKKSTDNLNIFYTPPRLKIVHDAATHDPVPV
jgi:hypothetical protein